MLLPPSLGLPVYLEKLDLQGCLPRYTSLPKVYT